ncbi:retropepsin-like aspartic protease [Alkalihalobacillus pseudalcaliphilus]|uniref:retropepsin-like aspartic protease n=1 Tax=Alkalihalobacillus pseudalcaliphilus TaxID=79884 RepID=UPI00064DC38C|nr:retropepsin-like aspartic protease [Alkalihalobacillus pseudalcaliphilus]KMK77969.1 hypothetical protein AB990_00485 [Alkalihalobacillus pseudalcaliphilus]
MSCLSLHEFKLIDNLIFLNCTINDESRTFILDSGSPSIVLNNKYLDTYEQSHDHTLKGATGPISDVGKIRLQSLKCGTIEKYDIETLVMNLSQLEIEDERKVYGLIGYDFFNKNNVYLDYQNQKFGFWDDNELEKYLEAKNFSYYQFEMNGHLPIITCGIGGYSYRIALDTGANTNLFDHKLLNILGRNMKFEGEKNILGANEGIAESNYKFGKMMNFDIKGLGSFTDMDTVFADVSHLNQNKDLKIHGIVGYQLFKDSQVIISFTKRKLYILG